jgi:hypothetical protein
MRPFPRRGKVVMHLLRRLPVVPRGICSETRLANAHMFRVPLWSIRTTENTRMDRCSSGITLLPQLWIWSGAMGALAEKLAGLHRSCNNGWPLRGRARHRTADVHWPFRAEQSIRQRPRESGIVRLQHKDAISRSRVDEQQSGSIHEVPHICTRRAQRDRQSAMTSRL